MQNVTNLIKLTEEEYKKIVMKEKANVLFFTPKKFKKYDFSGDLFFNNRKEHNKFKISKVIEYDPLKKDENYFDVVRFSYLSWCLINKKEIEDKENFLDDKEFKEYFYHQLNFFHSGIGYAVFIEKAKI